MTIKWNGNAVVGNVKKKLKSRLDTLARVLLDDTKSLCPVADPKYRNSGKLKRSLSSKVTQDSIQIIAAVDYAVEVEMRTRFMTRALERSQTYARRILNG